ncbi:MAG: hypothetical protein ACLUEK_13165 [Oscillospiraceae bacterium]
MRDGIVIFEGEMASLRALQGRRQEVAAGYSAASRLKSSTTNARATSSKPTS